MGLLPDTKICGLRMRRESRERFPRHPLQSKSLVIDPGMHHGTCVTHVPWCMSGSITPGDGKNVPGIPGACATRNFAYLTRGPLAWFPPNGSTWNDTIANKIYLVDDVISKPFTMDIITNVEICKLYLWSGGKGHKAVQNHSEACGLQVYD